MATPTQFRHYVISQDADGGNIEIARSTGQVSVLAFDSRRLEFVHCHVLLQPLNNRRAFEDRAHKLGMTGHPLLARVLDFGEDDGSPFYVTENVDGETLRSLFSRQAELPVWLAAKLTELSLTALQALGERLDCAPLQPLDALRVLQTGPRDLQVHLADFRLGEAVTEVAPRGRKAKSAHEKQARFLSDYFKEQARNPGTQSGEAMLNREDFSEVLANLLLSCSPESRGAMGALRESLAASFPEQPAGELPPHFKPRSVIGPFLASFQEVARSVSQTVRLQSQKLDVGQPYALRGTLLKSSQPIMVEQVPPARLTGVAPGEALRQARNLPASGRFPNLVPVVFVGENEGLECAAETAVEGLTLGELMAARGSLEAQEAYLVLAGVDTALGQLEKAARAMRRLRLEDVFLFTGFGKESALETGLLGARLNEWPGFSIVLRGHPCLHAMSGRGTDPGLLLPVEPASKDGVEPIWNGGWLAALGAFLIGTVDNADGRQGIGAELITRLLQDELAGARKGNPGTRAAFLARFARVMNEHDLARVKGGGYGQEVGGPTGAPSHAAQVARAIGEPLPARLPLPRSTASKTEPFPMEEQEVQVIGFAEALIHSSTDMEARRPGDTEGLMDSELQDYSVESSWTGFRQDWPVWIRVTAFALGAIAAGALLAQLQGRALWQGRIPRGPAPAPQVPAEAAGTGNVKPPVAIPVEEKPSLPKLKPSQKPLFAPTNPEPAPKNAVLKPDTPDERQRQVRLGGGGLPKEWRAETEGAARKGDTKAMIALGNALLRGESGAVDERAAFGWFEKAVQAGDKAAVVSLAGCYLQGWGTEPDFPQAVSLLNRAANNGDTEAMDLLGVCYARGLGVPRDDAKAFELVRQAYAGGVPSACGNLGAMYLRGQGVTAEPARAAELFAEGSKKGHAESMLLYARSLENGIGLRADAAEAARWYRQAARMGNAEAAAWCLRKGLAL